MIRFVFGLFLLFALLACSDSESVGASENNSGIANITLIASINGIGDNSYNDQILAGLFRFNEDSGVPFRLLQPESMDEADSLVKAWLKENADTDSSLLILASSAYAGLAQKLDIRFSGDGNKVLLFEADSAGLPQDVYSFSIDRYGASYLSGAILGINPCIILAAAPGFTTLETSIDGFRKGYDAHKAVKDSLSIVYVSETENDETAFNDIELAYMAMFSILYTQDTNYVSAIFPLLGGAIKGARRAMIDYTLSGDFMIGMDVDQSGVLPTVPFTLTIAIKDIVVRYLDEWISGKEWPRFRSLGLGDGATAIVFNKNFGDTKNFEARHDKYYDEAVREEARHANQ
jgi:basic membrane lipoprotein Med (substrate-binding protein (PBP1-ABC) superfamily)